jgi:hypothetical protein
MFLELAAVRRRLRLQVAFEAGVRASVVGAALILVAVYLWRLGILRSPWLGIAAAFAVVLAYALARALKAIPMERVAKRIDITHQLHDRIGSAYYFSAQKEKTPFMEAAIADARAQTIDPRRAAPYRTPEGLSLTGVTLAIAAGVALLIFPGKNEVRPIAAPRVPHLFVDSDALTPEKDAVEELQRAAEETNDPALKEATDELNKLLQQVQNEELTRKQVFDKLSEIEKKIRPGSDGDFEELKRMLKKAGAELSKEKLTREAGQALEKEDLQQAKKELEKLAADAEKLDQEKKKENEQKREELARSLDRASKQQEQMSQEEKKRQEEEKKLKEEERRLKKELAEKPNDQELQRKLQRNQRELQRLEKEKQQRAEQQRQLQRLQKEMQKAAEQLRQKLSPQAAEALRKAAQQLGQMENEIKKLGTGQRTQMQIAEIKEVLRRVGKSSGGQQSSAAGRESGKGDQQGQASNGQQGQNGNSPKNGKGDKQGQMLREFNSRAGGKPNALLLGAGNGDQRVLLPLGGKGDQPGQMGQGQGQELPGDGIGDQHDPNLMGDKTKIDSHRKETRVEGKEGAGPSRSETILGSADKGFSSRAYKRVYGDYSSVVEEVMSKEKVPPGYRFYVKRYFQLIKPREE